MTVEFISARSANSGNSNVGNQAVLLPGGWKPDDIAIWAGMVNTISPVITWNAPGFQFLDGTPFNASSAQIWVAWQRLKSSSASPSIKLSSVGKVTQVMLLYRGASRTSPPLMGTRYSRPSSLNTITSPGLITSAPDQRVVHVFMEKSTTASSVTTPFGTRRTSQFGTGGGQVSNTTVDEVVATAGATGQRVATYDIASTVGYGISLALLDGDTTSAGSGSNLYQLTSGHTVTRKTYRLQGGVLT
jgi:hypothetical protein